ncbi:hypothetical protein HMPREF3036_00406 [Sutterella sp. KLE1602]|nr:hypothetical protein HMPREF3036_00406 [Sutterella sp. KLE1602]
MKPSKRAGASSSQAFAPIEQHSSLPNKKRKRHSTLPFLLSGLRPDAVQRASQAP